jgi:hypothetical protein
MLNERHAGMQSNWRWCQRCQGLFYAGNNSLGRCPAADEHSLTGSGDYTLGSASAGPGGQPNWRHCERCQGLFFTGNNSLGRCPAGETHVPGGSGNYGLSVGPTVHPVRAEHLVTWQSFGSLGPDAPPVRLQDDCDDIRVAVTERADGGGVPLVALETGPGVGARKRIKLLAPDGRTLVEKSTDGENQRRCFEMRPDDVLTAALVLGKQKLNPFDSYDMYQLSTMGPDQGALFTGLNRMYTFRWVRDRC